MATLKLTSLRCIRKQDVTGTDEPRILVDGDEVWRSSVNKGGTVPIGWSGPFEDHVTVIAEELNGSKGKQIGNPATVRESGNPDYLTFKTSGAHYEVYFVVTP